MPAPIVPAPTTPTTSAALAAGPDAAPALSSSFTGRSVTSGPLLAARRWGRSRRHERADSGERAPDDQFLDLRGALVERRNTRVAVVALHRVVVHVARAAVDLDREVRALKRGLRRVELRDRGLERVRKPLVLQPAGAPDEHPRGIRLEHHVGDHR